MHRKVRLPNGPAYARLCLAATAALVASVGDFLMLYVALGNAPPHTSPGFIMLTAGGLLGVIAVPAYFVGYHASRQLFFQAAAPTISPFLVLAAFVAAFGALTHALTAIDIYNALASGATTRPPHEAFASFSPLVFTGIGAALACVGAVLIMFRAGRQTHSTHMKTLAYFNPVSGSVALNAVALLIGDAGQYLAPAAPNLAHAIFFFACARRIKSTSG